MYSLISSPVLGFDLARMPGGAKVAQVIAGALQVDEKGLTTLACFARESEQRDQAWLEVSVASHRNALGLSAVIPETVEDSAELAALLEQAPLGNLDALLRCLREEIFDWVGEEDVLHRGVGVVCDAAAAGYTYGMISQESFDALWQPWEHALQECALENGHQLNAGVSDLLSRLHEADELDRTRLGQASDRWRFRDPSWATAVHDASWAVTLANRTREAALAQVELVQAFATARWPVSALAEGGWNTMSGAIHALVVRDLVSSETSHRLLAPCVEAFGPLTPRGGLSEKG